MRTLSSRVIDGQSAGNREFIVWTGTCAPWPASRRARSRGHRAATMLADPAERYLHEHMEVRYEPLAAALFGRTAPPPLTAETSGSGLEVVCSRPPGSRHGRCSRPARPAVAVRRRLWACVRSGRHPGDGRVMLRPYRVSCLWGDRGESNSCLQRRLKCGVVRASHA